MITCAIVDDEPLAVELLKSYIDQVPFLQLQHTCANGMEAMALLTTKAIDLVFLDINMPKLSGIHLIQSLIKPPAVIFTTAYEQYALTGFDLHAVDYLLKPFSFERFLKAVHKSAKVLETPPSTAVLPNVSEDAKETFFFKVGTKYTQVELKDILFIKGLKDYVSIHMGNEKRLIVLQTMKYLEDQLPSEQFLRVHNSYIVAIKAIEALDGHRIFIKSHEIPVSKKYRNKVLMAIDRLQL